MSLGATNFPKLGIILKLFRESEKFFLPAITFHRCSPEQLEGTLPMAQNSKHTTKEVRFRSVGESNGLMKLRDSNGSLLSFSNLIIKRDS